ncbi:MAG: LytR/AlgR family response regulator transcription factor [Bacteroidia bacterium]
MIKTIIIDDEARGRDTLKNLLKRYCFEVEVTGEAGSVLDGFKLINNEAPDLVFLDIEMPGHNGFDLLEMFKEIPFKVIFTTAYDKYAIKAIKYSALDYLLKPIDIDELILSISRVNNTKKDAGQAKYDVLFNNIKSENKRKKVAIPDIEGLVFIYLDEIVRCESDSNYTYIHLINKKRITASRTLRDFEELFSEENFFRVHRSHLINLEHLKKYIKGEGGFAVMADDSKVEVSRRKKSEFMEVLAHI